VPRPRRAAAPALNPQQGEIEVSIGRDHVSRAFAAVRLPDRQVPAAGHDMGAGREKAVAPARARRRASLRGAGLEGDHQVAGRIEADAVRADRRRAPWVWIVHGLNPRAMELGSFTHPQRSMNCWPGRGRLFVSAERDKVFASANVQLRL
jgi:hypothetical protein